MSIFGMHNLQTTVRLAVVLPDNYGYVQRLYDDGIHFTLQEETVTDIEKLIKLVEGMNSQGGRMIGISHYISDDDLQPKTCVRYEYHT